MSDSIDNIIQQVQELANRQENNLNQFVYYYIAIELLNNLKNTMKNTKNKRNLSSLIVELGAIYEAEKIILRNEEHQK